MFKKMQEPVTFQNTFPTPLTLLLGDVPSESAAIRLVTFVPMGTSSSNVIGLGVDKNDGGISFTSCNSAKT